MMSNENMLVEVKKGLCISGEYTDDTLMAKTLAVKGFILNAGVTSANLETELGLATLTVGVNDLWNLNPGEVKFSPAFSILLTQLQAMSLS
ncbi:phage gp6-like head-tail connector protein [Ruminiclostridium cellobioparum]|uniref:phage gp6-like head-tail connector protein n=1 Tax=Ruminiclostridium cellobioparum TaxID=29355 RepID=UPI000A9500C6|nr:phage gp6-like head-tail connector protein [Ruminiclostridium cellobioparum]